MSHDELLERIRTRERTTETARQIAEDIASYYEDVDCVLVHDGLADTIEKALADSYCEIERLKVENKRLHDGLCDKERVMEACNDFSRRARKQIEDLWPEAERPPGFWAICDKLAEARQILEPFAYRFAHSPASRFLEPTMTGPPAIAAASPT